jgi:hypothetical protein
VVRSLTRIMRIFKEVEEKEGGGNKKDRNDE